LIMRHRLSSRQRPTGVVRVNGALVGDQPV
jgi:hypothetical protein